MNPDPAQIQRNAELRQELSRNPQPVPNLDYLGPAPETAYPVSVCIALKDRANTLRQGLDSLAQWFQRDPRPNEVVIADFGSSDCSPSRELKGRGIRGKVVRLDGYFSRARGLHRAAEAAKHQIILFSDADILYPVNMGDTLRRIVNEGTCLFPVCMDLDRAGKERGWRGTGYGLVAIHADDYDRIGGWDLSIRRWGGEDDDLHWHARRRLEVERLCISGLYHQHHTKQGKDTYTDPEAPTVAGQWTPPEKARPPVDLIEVPTSWLRPSLDRWGFHLDTVRQFERDPEIPATETAYYRGVLDYKRKGGNLWAEVGTGDDVKPDKIVQRVEKLRRLYREIRDGGYDPTCPIAVAIDSTGAIGTVDGHHRSAVATVLGIESLPARVRSRAPEWVEIRDLLHERYKAPKLYTEIHHPDFAGWEVARDTWCRAKAILGQLSPMDKVIDIGSSTGGISVAVALGPYYVTAIERDARMVRVGKAVSGPHGLEILWLTGNAWDMSPGRHHVALCLSVLHHEVKAGKEARAIDWLKRHADRIIVEMADGRETQMQGCGLPESQEGLGAWLSQNFGMEATPILKGVPEEHRKSASDRRWLWLLR